MTIFQPARFISDGIVQAITAGRSVSGVKMSIPDASRTVVMDFWFRGHEVFYDNVLILGPLVHIDTSVGMYPPVREKQIRPEDPYLRFPFH